MTGLPSCLVQDDTVTLEANHGFLLVLASVYESTLPCIFRYMISIDAMIIDTFLPLFIRILLLVSSLSCCSYTSFFT